MKKILSMIAISQLLMATAYADPPVAVIVNPRPNPKAKNMGTRR